MSRFSAQLISTGATPSARKLQRILNARAVSPASTASASANTSKRLWFATDSSTLGLVHLLTRGREHEPLDLLIRGEQVAFDALREQLCRRRRELQARAARALLNPARQLRALDRPHLDDHTLLIDRFDPRGLLRGGVELLADADDEDPVRIVAFARAPRWSSSPRRRAAATASAARRSCASRTARDCRAAPSSSAQRKLRSVTWSSRVVKPLLRAAARTASSASSTSSGSSPATRYTCESPPASWRSSWRDGIFRPDLRVA